jgi:hypothetical protein
MYRTMGYVVRTMPTEADTYPDLLNRQSQCLSGAFMIFVVQGIAQSGFLKQA